MEQERELTGEALTLTALTMLIGEEGIDFSHYEIDLDWLAIRLWIRRN